MSTNRRDYKQAQTVKLQVHFTVVKFLIVFVQF